MMYKKAELFRDKDNAAKILKAKSPGEAKALGRMVRGFDERTWFDARWDIAFAGNLAKFAQNAELRKFLIGTGDRVLVEASPIDRIWGIGMDKEAAMHTNPSQWLGQNLLGFALMEVRSELMRSVD